MNNRRKVVIVLGAGALTAAFGSFAQQQGKIWRIGFLWVGEQSYYSKRLEAFDAGMRALGYAEGKDYVIEQRSGQADIARLPALAAELVALKVDLIVSSGTPSAVAASKATREIPVLTTTAGDPVGSGLAATLSRPGGNITGLTSMNADLYTKRLDLLRQISPGIRRVGFLYNPDSVSDTLGLRQFESDCYKLKFKSVRAPVRKAAEIAATFEALRHDKAQGLIVTGAGTNNTWRKSIVEQAAKHRMPAMYANYYADSTGLISFGTNFPDQYRRAATYVDKIMKGAKPGDLPIEQPTKFELVVNLKTAKALGIRIPNSILVQATKVIE